jgi:Rrf2 family iron-sulfur cluster assembly transcriptional regulator
MRITQEGDYALRVVRYLFLYGNCGRVEAKVISEQENIPLRFLLKLLRKLVAAGVIKSYRGSGGGYATLNQPKDITLRQVIEAIEGPININRCLLNPDLCNLKRAETCDIHKALDGIQLKLIKELDAVNFEQIIKAK